jgi:uncharacterized membrane protein YgdD (TMEM256/DUF423 family)
MDRLFFTVGCVFGLLGVALGAFGAHALKGRLSPEMLSVFETGVRYQLVHAVALLAVAWACTRWPGWAVKVAGWLFVAGVGLFAGSLYALSITGLRAYGAITPIGGVAFLAGWGCLAWAPWSRRP